MTHILLKFAPLYRASIWQEKDLERRVFLFLLFFGRVLGICLMFVGRKKRRLLCVLGDKEGKGWRGTFLGSEAIGMGEQKMGRWEEGFCN